MDADELFGMVLAHHHDLRDEIGGKGFGSGALKVNGKIFASLTKGQKLLLKLPRERVANLIDAGIAEPFSTGEGRVKKEWVTITSERGHHWVALSVEARIFVSA
jgi:hypothetical protein